MEIIEVIEDHTQKENNDMIIEIEKPNNPEHKINKKDFEIIFPTQILETLEKIILSQNQDLLKIIGEESIIDYHKFKECINHDNKIFIEIINKNK